MYELKIRNPDPETALSQVELTPFFRLQVILTVIWVDNPTNN